MERRWVIVLERGDGPAMVVGPFENEEQAKAIRRALEIGTESEWEDDPGWHNYACEPIQLARPAEALQLIRRDLLKERRDQHENRLGFAQD